MKLSNANEEIENNKDKMSREVAQIEITDKTHDDGTDRANSNNHQRNGFQNKGYGIITHLTR
jgi:hypothetical protein